ncbi:hypothetical protein DFH06DRAFT_1139033 [Mycena polygramma]|nr:hypothetical protein DFH06DRAFT_1139033 [Mycena polygramma]
MPGAHSSIFIPYSPSASPVTRKRARLDRTPTSSLPATPTRRSVPPLPHSPYLFNANNEVVDNPSPLIPSQPAFAPIIPAATVSLPQADAGASAMQQAMDALEARSHLIRQTIAAEEQSDKETGATYARQVQNYEAWWILSQALLLRDGPAHVSIPAFPITAAKVTVYLEYETTCPQKRKRDDNSESTATIGISGVKQVVSALENWRFSNQHKYLDVPAAQVGLRLDIRIKTFESAAAHKEPQRVKMAHTLKAKGTNADTFTATDLMRCALWCLTNFKGPAQTYIGLRDRAMLLTSCSVAFRGDSTRSLLLSDLFVTDVVMNAKGLGATVPIIETHPLPLEIPQMQDALDFRFEAPGSALFELAPQMIQKFDMAHSHVFCTCKAAQILTNPPSTFAAWSGYWKIHTTLVHTGSVMHENRPTPANGLYYVRNAWQSGMLRNT